MSKLDDHYSFLSESFRVAVWSMLEVLALEPGSKEAERAFWKAQWELLQLGVSETTWALASSEPTLTVQTPSVALVFHVQAPAIVREKWVTHWGTSSKSTICPLKMCAEAGLPLDLVEIRKIDTLKGGVSFECSSVWSNNDKGFDVALDHQSLSWCAAVEDNNLPAAEELLERGVQCSKAVWHRWARQMSVVGLNDREVPRTYSGMGAILLKGSPSELALEWLGSTKGWRALPEMVEAFEKALVGRLDQPFMPPPYNKDASPRFTPLQFAYLHVHYPLLEALVLAGAKTNTVAPESEMPDWTLVGALNGQYRSPSKADNPLVASYFFEQDPGNPKLWKTTDASDLRKLVNARERIVLLEKVLEPEESTARRPVVRF